MLRLDTTKATIVTEAFSPSKAGILQAKIGADSLAKIELLMRVDPDADWLPLALWDPTKDKLFALQPFPFVKIKLIDNKEGERVQIWDSEAVKAAPKPEPINDKIPARVKPKDDHVRDYAEVVDNTKGDKIPEMRRTFAEPIEEVPAEHDRIAEPAEI